MPLFDSAAHTWQWQITDRALCALQTIPLSLKNHFDPPAQAIIVFRPKAIWFFHKDVSLPWTQISHIPAQNDLYLFPLRIASTKFKHTLLARRMLVSIANINVD